MALSTLKRLGKLPFVVAALIATPSALAGTLTNVSVVPDDASPGATTNYTFTYTLEQDVNADEALFYVTFPDGAGEFSVATGACDRIASITLNPVPMGGAAICRASYGSGNTVGFAVNTSIGGGVSVPGGTEVEIVVSGVTNPTAPGNYDFDHADGTGIITTQMMDPMFPMVMEKDIAGQQTVTIGSGSAVNGACGTSVGGVFTSAPAVSLCATGTATAVTTNATTYTWGCNGTGGGTSTAANACSADLGYDLILSVSPPSGGSISCGSNPVRHGDNRTCTPTASAGYTFVNWTGDCTGASCVLNNVTSALNPQANFALITHSITTTVVPASAGSISCTNNPVDDGDDSTCTYTANAGYTFANWSGDCTGATCALTGVTANKSVTANFTAPTFTITVNTSGSGTASCTPNPVSGGSNATCTASPSAGNSFTGWSGDCTGSTCVLTAVSTNKTVTANFATSTYSISGSAAPVAGGSVSCSGSVSHGSNGSCTATANTGYTFASWNGCPSASANSCNFTNVTSNQSVTANFTINSYAVSATVVPTSTGTVICSSPVNHGANTTCTATPDTGYSLTSWTGCSTTSGLTCNLSNVTSDTSVTANFAVATYILTGTSAPVAGGTVNCDSNVSFGTDGSCTATANPGYTLTNWSGCTYVTSNGGCFILDVISNQSVTANFTINSYTVTAVANPIDAGSVSCTSPVKHGANASCTANAAGGYKFTGWSGACSGSSCSIANVTSNTSVTASFALLPTYNVSTSVSPANSGKITCSKDIFEGGNGTCTAKASAGYRLKAWGGDCSGSAESCTLTNVTSAKSVSATFEEANTFTITARLESLTGYYSALSPKPNIGGFFGASLNCSHANPVTINSTVTCTIDEGLELMDIGRYRGWSGGCSRVEGRNCIIENITTDKQITVLYGYNETNSNAINVHPAGAGSVWCGATLSVVSLNADYVRQHCVAQANPGYTFTGFSNTQSYAVNANFTKQTGTPSVVCTNCNTSSLTADDDSTTKSVTKTSEPDAQGNSTQLTLSTTTNNETGTTISDILVSLGVSESSFVRFTTNNPTTEFTVNDTKIDSVIYNAQTGEYTYVSASSDKITTKVEKDGANIAEVGTISGQTAAVNTTASGTTIAVTNSATGATLGTTTVSGSTTTTTTGDASASADGSTVVRNAARGDSASTSTFYGAGTVISSSLFGSSSVTTTQSLGGGSGSGSGSGNPVVMAIASSQTTSLISGAISGGFVSTGTGGFTPSVISNSLGGFSLSNVSASASKGSFSPGNKPVSQKTSAADDNNQAAIDITGGTLQSVQLYSDSTGLVEFFKPGVDAGSPQMTAFESTDDTFSITLSYPAKN